MSDEKKIYIDFKINQAKETYAAAEIMFENKMYNSVSNRIYYASFYIVQAALHKFDQQSSSHKGAKILFNQSFIKEKKTEEKWGVFYSKIFALRDDGDYGDFVVYTKEQVEELFLQTKIFIETIEQLIHDQRTL
ncbi:MAG: hypothetical protein RL065_2261 [Bacteroidota bacterium]|jgi:uncharacterized protein (UPF0332 family)